MKKLLAFLILFAAMPLPAYSQESDDEEDEFESDDDLDEIEDYSEYDDDEVKENENERVKYFDVAGISLGMDEDGVKAAMKERKYVLKDTIQTVPEFFQYNYDADCRGRKIFEAGALKDCINGLAKKDKILYTSRLSYKKPDTGETVDTYFTSPLTQSRVWKADYQNNDVNEKLGPAKNFQYQREERRRAFWFFVKQKYGEANVGAGRWVMNTDDPYSPRLVASFGRLVISSEQANLTDIRETQIEARRSFKYKDFTF